MSAPAPMTATEKGSNVSHYRWECKHGLVSVQCRCIGPKTVKIVPCSAVRYHDAKLTAKESRPNDERPTR